MSNDFSDALFNCSKPGMSLKQQLDAHMNLRERIAAGEFVTKPEPSGTAVIIPLPNRAMSGFSVRKAMRDDGPEAA